MAQQLCSLLSVDAALSVRIFNILSNYTLDWLSRYHSEYFGAQAMKIGFIQFGHGIIMEYDVTTSPSMNAHTLLSDLVSMKSFIEGMVQKQGFTSVAQAFALAVTMCTSAGRKNAQSALMVVNDGKPSLQNQTNDLVEQRDDKGCSASLSSNRRTRRAST